MYTLVVEVNPVNASGVRHRLESNYSNNMALVPFEITESTCSANYTVTSGKSRTVGLSFPINDKDRVYINATTWATQKIVL